MRVQFWGVRGSIPAPGQTTSRFGGNTPCVEVNAEGERIIIDAGTGIRELGEALIKRADSQPIMGTLLIGHTHWDHIQGFPFFTPLYNPKNRFKVYGAHGTTKSFQDVMAGQMGSAYFPVQLRDMLSKPVFDELRAPIMVGPVKISYHYLNHPGITIGFRLEHAGKSVAYISDHEPYQSLNAKGEFSVKEDIAVAKFVEGCDLLVCESQYTSDEYRVKKGWGHSTFNDVLGLAQLAQVKRLSLFHHDPTHDDAAMQAFEKECQKIASNHHSKIEVFAAREGQVIEL